MNLLVLAGWATCFFVAWIGVGNCALRLLGTEEQSWPLSGVVGVAILVLVGGWLNLANLVHPGLLVGIVAFGDVLFLVQLIHARSLIESACSGFCALSVTSRILAALCGLVLLSAALNSLCFARFSTFDDLPAYLTFPEKLLQLGSLPYDPFSERRVQSGLGANYFLQAFMLLAGDVRSLWFVDAGAGLVLFVGCIYRAARKLGNTVHVSILLLALPLVVPLSHVNLTSTVLPAAIFTAIFLVEVQENNSPLVNSLLLGLLGAAVSVLKSTYLPVAVLVLAGMPMLRLRKGSVARVSLVIVVSFGVYMVTVLPWMLDMRKKEGTLLYPLLGKGYDIFAYGRVAHVIDPGIYPVFVGGIFMLAFVTVGILHWLAAEKYRYTAQISCLLLVGGIVALPLSVSTGASSFLRYISPFDLPFTLLLLASLLRISSTRPPWHWIRTVSYASAIGLLIVMAGYGATHSNFVIYQHPYHGPRRFSDAGSIILDANDIQRERQRALRLQASFQPGQSVFADYMVTFPMDFRRNTIYVADFPGMSSLPPGMPTHVGPEALRAYLLDKSIGLVAYSSHGADLREQGLLWKAPKSGSWPRMQSLNSVDVDHEIEALAKTYCVIYDDGDEKVVDLSLRAGPVHENPSRCVH